MNVYKLLELFDEFDVEFEIVDIDKYGHELYDDDEIYNNSHDLIIKIDIENIVDDFDELFVKIHELHDNNIKILKGHFNNEYIITNLNSNYKLL